MPIKIDSHQHFWKYDPRRYSWIDESMAGIRRDFYPDDLEPVLKQNGFDGCIAVQADQSEEETKFLLDLANKHQFIKGVVGWVNLNSDDVESQLSGYSRDPLFKGVRTTVYDEAGEFMLDPKFLHGISLLKDWSLTYDILGFSYQLPGAIFLADRFPDQPFVLDHLAKPNISSGVSETWKTQIEELAKNKNVSCKLSGMVTETENFQWEKQNFYPFLEVVANAFGEDRLLFGSDWPVCLSAASYSDTVEILENFFNDQSVLDKIMGINAAKVYKI